MAQNEKQTNRHRPYWEQACEDCKNNLASFALKLANGKLYDAEDLVQETTCRALFYSPNPAKIVSPLSYLLVVMRNAWIDKWRHDETDNTVSLESIKISHPTVSPDALRILENKELVDRFDTGQGPLNKREKTLITLYLMGYKCGEIARRLNEDVRLTRSDLNAVRNKVRYRLRNSKGITKNEPTRGDAQTKAAGHL